MFFRYNFYAFAWAAAIFALNLGRSESLPLQEIFYLVNFDKLAHFLQFFLLSFLLIVGFSKQHSFISLRFRAIRVGLLVASIYAVILEIIQFIRLNEYFELADLGANLFGVLVGGLVFYFIYKY